jgi:cytochrome c oxidase, subunit II
MQKGFQLWPDTASEWASKVDALHIALGVHNFLFTAAVFLLVTIFAIYFRRRGESDRPRAAQPSQALEIPFMMAGLFLWMGFFAWGATLYFEYASPPSNAMEIFITGKQWMFFAQHPEGQREINELHVPLGRPVRLTMSSEDVIHSYFIPAFRIKRDVVPGRYTNLWFTANKPGTYHLFCAEYCGTQHSGMVGWVYVMEPAAYEEWLAGTSGGGMGSMAAQGEQLFSRFGCSSCHRLDVQGRCPNLNGVFGSTVQLTGGGTVTADEAYVRESILNPSAKVVAGFQNIMPSFQGQVSEQNILQLIAFVKSLGAQPKSGAAASGQGANTNRLIIKKDNTTQGRQLRTQP